MKRYKSETIVSVCRSYVIMGFIDTDEIDGKRISINVFVPFEIKT